MIFRAKIIITVSLFFAASNIQGQWEGGWIPAIEDSMEVYNDLFGLEEALNITMVTNFKTFRRNRSKGEYQAAAMTIQVSDSFKMVHPVRLKARGIYRRDNCAMPPVWLNVRYSGIESRELSGIRRMKMVCMCKPNDRYGEYILREYLVYKIYNLLTPYSFRVRLINLTLVDTGKDNKEQKGWAFLIEPAEMMARRLDAKELKSDELSMRTVNEEAMDRLAMFQYMIGNPDYSVTGRHNLKILASQVSGPHGFIPVPYDFDFTGLVNAIYAFPNETLELSSVRERYFRGPCRDGVSYEKALASLEAVRDEIEATIWAFDKLEEEARFDMIGFIESFFNTASNEHFIDREISRTCR